MELKVGITGQSGFMGRHLYNYLSLKEELNLVNFDRSFEHLDGREYHKCPFTVIYGLQVKLKCLPSVVFKFVFVVEDPARGGNSAWTGNREGVKVQAENKEIKFTQY